MKLLDIMTAPWAIVPEKLAEIRELYKTHLRGEKIDIKGIEARITAAIGKQEIRDGYEIKDGVAVIPITDVITKHITFFSFFFGGSSTKAIGAMLADALENSAVESILFYIDSPGGTVDGVQELAEQIYNARGQKPMVSYTDGIMASAAYYIGAAADAVMISGDMTQVGSIGVAVRHLDYSRSNEMRGYKETDIYFGKYKRIATGNRPLSKEGKEYLQDQVDYIGSIFVDDIAKYRGVTPEEVLEKIADGKIFIGTQAMDAGLADGVFAYDLLINKMTAGDADIFANSKIRKESEIMDLKELKEKHPDIFKAAFDEGHTAGKEMLSNDAKEAATAAAAAECRRIQDVEAQLIPGHEALIEEMKFDGKTTGEQAAVRILQAEKALRNATVEQLNHDSPNPVAHADAENDTDLAGTAEGPEKWKAEFERDPKLKAEFKSIETYVAYKQGTSSGRVRILGAKA